MVSLAGSPPEEAEKMNTPTRDCDAMPAAGKSRVRTGAPARREPGGGAPREVGGQGRAAGSSPERTG